jgi:ribonucleoside-diphosphate reductase alpha chain
MQPQEISQAVLLEKYAKFGETGRGEIFARVARALAAAEAEPSQWEPRFREALDSGFIPAGRILSAAGTSIQATLINCFVQPVGDSISECVDGKPGIYTALAEAAETMRRGGGVGYDFSAIRPRGAWVHSTASRASGPVSYMHVFDRSCETVESAGARRGAQMGVLRCDHPDVFDFVQAKECPGELSNFNLSVALTESFLRAVEGDGPWDLVHRAEPSPEQQCDGAYRRADGLWVYRTVRARDLWELIMRSTYDHAEPGVLFLDRINAENNLYYCEIIEATNPCVTADTWVMTASGARQVRDLVGKPFVAVVDGKAYPTESAGFFVTARKPVLKLHTAEGPALRLTADHPVLRVSRRTRYLRETEWTKAGELKAGDEIVLHDHRSLAGWSGAHTEAEGYLIGLLIGDGTLKTDKAVLSVWDAQGWQQANGAFVASAGAAGIMRAAGEAARSLPHRADFRGWQKAVEGRGEYRMVLGAVRELALSLGLRPGQKRLTPAIEQASSDFYRGLLRGLFDAAGSVQGSQSKGVSVRLTQIDRDNLETVQRMLLRLGIVSTIYGERRPAGMRELPNGKNGASAYATQPLPELVVSGDNLARFAECVGFADAEKASRLADALAAYRRTLHRERFIATVAFLEDDGVEEVYDVTVSEVHAFDANGLYAHNCAEQPLPAYGCCCLGSIDLTRFVERPFQEGAWFDFGGFCTLIPLAVRMLDNVLEVTYWPLPQQREEALAKRRIGLGFTGLGDALVMLGLRYDTQEAREQAAEIARVLRDVAYQSSVDLAREKGPFPRFDVEPYLRAPFVARLPAELHSAIRSVGIRNSHLLSIAPTGTISLAFADNVSNGIEPPYAWTYMRRKRQADGTTREYPVEDHAYRLYLERVGERAKLPPAFVTALEISAVDQMRMLGAVQPYIDSSISKTVNVPADYPYAEFQSLYLEAWKAGLKGLATYRPNPVTGAVLAAPEPAPTSVRPDFDESDPDRRLRLEEVPRPPLASLRWRRRPRPAGGNPAWSYLVDHPLGSFAVFIGHIEEESGKHPFEVWVNGAEQPRGLAALAKSLSMDMRSNDRGWLKVKLESLMRARGDDAFELPMPPDGGIVHVPSLVAGFARLVYYRCAELGAFESIGATPVLDALMSPKEPKTGPNGTLSWTVDVFNPATEDDFVMGLKELVLPQGQRRPYSVWLSGDYPRTLDGLCKCLSFDMRVIDPAWIGAKLRQLQDFPEPRGDFLARVPGNGRQRNFPSTIAYMVRLMIHRYAMLGLLDEEGQPVAEMGIMAYEDEDAGKMGETTTQRGMLRISPGRRCPECGAYALIRRDGCNFCTACGFLGACG